MKKMKVYYILIYYLAHTCIQSPVKDVERLMFGKSPFWFGQNLCMLVCSQVSLGTYMLFIYFIIIYTTLGLRMTKIPLQGKRDTYYLESLVWLMQKNRESHFATFFFYTAFSHAVQRSLVDVLWQTSGVIRYKDAFRNILFNFLKLFNKVYTWQILKINFAFLM